MSNEDFKTALTQLKVLPKLVDELADWHRIAFQASPGICEVARNGLAEKTGYAQDPRESPSGREIIRYAKEFSALQTAFAKAKPFPQPVNVNRGLKFKSQADAEQYVATLQRYRNEKKMFPLEGFQSTSTSDIPTTGRPDKLKGGSCTSSSLRSLLNKAWT